MTTLSVSEKQGVTWHVGLYHPGAGQGRFSNMQCRLGGSGGYIVFVDAEMPKHCHRRNAGEGAIHKQLKSSRNNTEGLVHNRGQERN